tara:strand:+ start:443 stop:628 length:186 start_codon:yes stop_codon:yes gene_type:complete
MKKLDNIKNIPSEMEMNLEIDPRSKSSANNAVRNRISVGTTVEVKGTKRMLASKSKKATWI